MSVDGKRVAGERLSSVVQLGDVLFSYSKPLVPSRTVGDMVVTRVAVQVRSLFLLEQLKKTFFFTFPDMERQALPWRCWHQDRRATAAAAVVHIRASAPALSVGGLPG